MAPRRLSVFSRSIACTCGRCRRGRGRCGRLWGRCGRGLALAWAWACLDTYSLASVTMVAGVLAAGGGGGSRRLRLAGAKGTDLLVGRSRRFAAFEQGKGHQAGGAAENVVANLALDAGHQLLEDLIGLGLVFPPADRAGRKPASRRSRASCPCRTDAPATACPRSQDDVALDGFERVGILETDLNSYRSRTALQMNWQTENWAALRPAKADPSTGNSWPCLPALMISSSGTPRGKLMLTQSARGRGAQSCGSALSGVNSRTLAMTLLHDVHQPVAHVVGVEDASSRKP